MVLEEFNLTYTAALPDLKSTMYHEFSNKLKRVVNLYLKLIFLNQFFHKPDDLSRLQTELEDHSSTVLVISLSPKINQPSLF